MARRHFMRSKKMAEWNQTQNDWYQRHYKMQLEEAFMTRDIEKIGMLISNSPSIDISFASFRYEIWINFFLKKHF